MEEVVVVQDATTCKAIAALAHEKEYIPIGHPGPDKHSTSLKRGRKPLENAIHWNEW